MSKSTFRANQVYNVISNKLEIQFRTSGPHFTGWYILEGKKTHRISVPKGRKTLSAGVQKDVREKLRLNEEEFSSLIECPMKGKDYAAKMQDLKGQGIL
ncbi:hypothetical protein FJZ31_35250 [Candidatus Poribacteria bacterium]|nr:hypothetical protein [Candidatus Poribacteria bacterium]